MFWSSFAHQTSWRILLLVLYPSSHQQPAKECHHDDSDSDCPSFLATIVCSHLEKRTRMCTPQERNFFSRSMSHSHLPPCSQQPLLRSSMQPADFKRQADFLSGVWMQPDLVSFMCLCHKRGWCFREESVQCQGNFTPTTRN
jgi:hypothetical protein